MIPNPFYLMVRHPGGSFYLKGIISDAPYRSLLRVIRNGNRPARPYAIQKELRAILHLVINFNS